MAGVGAVTQLDWAAFTSTTSIMGQGYRVIAATPGLTAEEKKAISTMSPSHNAMCSQSDDARGVAFYPLSRERMCVAYTQHAGKEQTGRGGKRVLTLAFALTAEQLVGFGWNPLAVVRALEHTRSLEPVIPKPGSLDVLDVHPCAVVSQSAIDNARHQLGEPATLCALSYAMSDGCLILNDVAEARDVVEAVLLATPSSMRMQCTFSIGLKFALSRRLRFHIIEPDSGATERIVRGQAIRFVADPDGYDPSAKGSTPWLEMVSDCRRTNHVPQLSALTAQVFDDTSAETLERVASRQTALNHVGEATIDDLVDLLMPGDYDTSDPPPRIEQWVIERHVAAATQRLTSLMSAAHADVVRDHWPRLLAAGETNAEVVRLCQSLAERVEDLDPPVAADADPIVTS